MTAQRKTTGITDVRIKQTARGDLFQIVTSDGTEYATFNSGMAHQARQLIGRNVFLTYTEKQVQKDGRWFTNLYYEGAEPALETFDNGPQQQQYTPPQQPQGSTYTSGATSWTGSTTTSNAASDGAVREKRILRQTATKVAAHMLAYLPENEQTPQGMLAVADFLVNYYENGYAGAFGMGDPGPSSPPHGDDDVPFMPTINETGF